MFEEHEQIVLTAHVKGHENEDLSSGDVGTVVEFMSLEGETVAIATVLPSQARALTRADITHARTMAPSTAA